ncbi:UDP-glucose 4-epimerase GalE [uncultured Cohaesibacter sp.]|uniref:UDP-glucose 4-epimerase GalE n=1 Tax=uncultured Cohaesibacter sp. TaxID=1002546 RepID=UPI00292DFE7C|nr:UDP-glucose 4-epimerase GalE [uncultured Cohaesibacter sp.]
MSSRVFLTGGAGYIGSHTCLELLISGYDVTIFDNFSNSHIEAVKRVEAIAGKKVALIKGDIRYHEKVAQALRESKSQAVIHFAGLKAVGESVENPLVYFDNNLAGSLSLLQAMREVGLKTLIFSSSATVYGEPQYLPIDEKHPLSVTNPYGRTKLMIEDILRDISSSDEDWSIGILRYFNPVGAHDSGRIGENPIGVPNNLVPYITQVMAGRLEKLRIWGNDYPTPDGTGVRDYIHVMDLARGHVKALEQISDHRCLALNLGTGIGYSVLDIVNTFADVCGQAVPFDMYPRRAGDIATCYADPKRAKDLLGWTAERDLKQMCSDHWRWQQRNPNGYL